MNASSDKRRARSDRPSTSTRTVVRVALLLLPSSPNGVCWYRSKIPRPRLIDDKSRTIRVKNKSARHFSRSGHGVRRRLRVTARILLDTARLRNIWADEDGVDEANTKKTKKMTETTLYARGSCFPCRKLRTCATTLPNFVFPV